MPNPADKQDSSKQEYYSFDKVLKELQIEEDELRRLVSEGEIRAFRDGEKMKFRPSDIDGLKKGRMTEPTIILPAGEPDSGEESEVLLVEESDNENDTSETDAVDLTAFEKSGEEVTGSSSTSIPTVDISNELAASDDFSDHSSADGASQDLTYSDDTQSSEHSNSADEILIDSSGELPSIRGSDGAKIRSFERSDITTELDSSDESLPSPADSYSDDDETGFQTEPLDQGLAKEEIQSSNLDVVDSTSGTGAEEEQTEVFTDSDATGEAAPYQEGGFAVEAAVPEYSFDTFEKTFLILSTLVLLFAGTIIMNALKDQDTQVTGWFTDAIYTVVPAKYPHWENKTKKIDVQNQIKTRKTWRDQ